MNKQTKRDRFLIFIVRLFNQSIEDRISAFAAQSAFFMLLSVVPFVILLLQLMRFTPYNQQDLMTLIMDILTELYSGSVSLVSITLIAALWASSKAMHSLSYGFDVIFAVPETRNWFVLRFWAILYTSVFAIGILAFLALTLLWRPIQTWIDGYLPHLFFLLDPEIKWLILLSLLTLVFALMYQTFPAVNLHFRPMLPGALFAALGWMIFSNILGIYANDYNGFSMYGSLTTLAMGMFWLYICMYLVMLGAEINSVLLGTRNR